MHVGLGGGAASFYQAQIDLTSPPPGVANDPLALATARDLARYPAFNHDGRTDILTGSEVAAILSSPWVYPHAKTAIRRLIPHLSVATQLSPAQGVPFEREQVRRLLAQRGQQVFSGIYP